MQLKPALKSRRRVRGVTMVEVLVAVVIFSAGLLGLLSAASLSIRTNAEAYQFTQVTNIADYIFGAMTRNAQGTFNRNYNSANFVAIDVASAPNAVRACQTGVCTSAQLAADDLTQVRQLMGQYLPIGARGSIACQPQAAFPNVTPFTVTRAPNTGDCLLTLEWTVDRNGTVESRSWSFQP